MSPQLEYLKYENIGISAEIESTVSIWNILTYELCSLNENFKYFHGLRNRTVDLLRNKIHQKHLRFEIN